MTRDELEHAIRAACAIAGDDELYIVGSQSILGPFPDASAALRRSMEVDVSPKTRLDRLDAIHGALGELSPFHRTHRFYVDAVDLAMIMLPTGWQGRLVPAYSPATNGCTGWCLDPADLAASKLAAFRDKDLDFVRELIGGRYLLTDVLQVRLQALPISAERIARAVAWMRRTEAELGSSPGAQQS